MKKALLSMLGLGLAMGASAQENADSSAFQFTDVKVVKTTSVKDQNKSGTCWCFAGTSFFEDEILRKTGKTKASILINVIALAYIVVVLGVNYLVGNLL